MELVVNRDNLRKLADYLMAGNLKKDFSMAAYCEVGLPGEPDFDSIVSPQLHACGTVGCALGHGPDAGIAPLDDESWNDYMERAFGIPLGPSMDQISPAYHWLFGFGWTLTDNSIQGAAWRIYEFLDNGIPDDAVAQMDGEAPYSRVRIGSRS